MEERMCGPEFLRMIARFLVSRAQRRTTTLQAAVVASHPVIVGLAREVAGECRGLPLTLITISMEEENAGML
uniref:Uncharacterized protein n=1 Tax=Oryza sativa subsp. japonica TaxID=39947 RepID=Q84NK1_ORYSJ|nr:hypothetical protein [Oryza sativa Japonica Group]BAD01183.1 hypothetical protein [Oryza sativa Japonica Group]